jgi:hypothetical protein
MPLHFNEKDFAHIKAAVLDGALADIDPAAHAETQRVAAQLPAVMRDLGLSDCRANREKAVEVLMRSAAAMQAAKQQPQSTD